MNIPTLQLCAIGSALAVLLSACGTPAVYRPEVGEFQKAATEVSTYVTAKQSAVELVRADLREEVLKSRRPLIAVSAECAEAAKKLADQSSPVNEGKDCRLTLPDDPDLEQIFNPKGQFTDSAAFAQAVEEYASALYKVATSGDKEAFLQAANGLGDAVISLAGSAAEAAGKAKPDPSTFTPITNLIGLGAFYYLENKRTEALKEAARTAHPWIREGSEGVKKVLYSAELEIAQPALEKIKEQVDEANEAGPNAYIEPAQQAIIQTAELRSEYIRDPPEAVFGKLPEAHQKLLEAFEDRDRNTAVAIAAAKDLFAAAREAHAAIVKKSN